MKRRRRLIQLTGTLVLVIVVALVLARRERPSDTRADDTPTWAGTTDQGEPMTAVVRGRQLVSFDAQVSLECRRGGFQPPLTMRMRWRATVPPRGSDGRPTFEHGRTTWQLTWLLAIAPGNTIVSRGPVPPSNRHPRPRPAATRILNAEMDGDTLRGTLVTSIAVPEATCTASLRYTLSRRR